MRTLLLVSIVTLFIAGCQQRSDMSAMPNRGGHAYNPDPQAAYQPTASTSTAPQAAQRHGGGGGRRVVVQKGERLYQIADREGVDLWQLILDNELVARPRAGDSLSLPR